MDNQYGNDEEILEGIKRGENAAIESLFDLLFEKMARLAFAITKSESDAEDIAITAFTTTVQSVEKFSQFKELKYYLREAVKNDSIDFIRKKERRRKKENEIAYNSSTFEEQIFDDIVKAESVNGIIEVMKGRCSEKQQQVLTFYYIDGLTSPQIGALLGISPENVRRIKSSAVKILKKYFENKDALILLLFLELGCRLCLNQ